MSKIKINFSKKTQDEEFVYSPNKFTDSFYQFCQIKNPKSGLYSTRKIIFNELFNIIQVYQKEYDINMIKQYMRNTKSNKYKIYPTDNIELVDLPNGNDLIQSRSEMINNIGSLNETITYNDYMCDFGANCNVKQSKNNNKYIKLISPNKNQMEMINNNTFA